MPTRFFCRPFVALAALCFVLPFVARAQQSGIPQLPVRIGASARATIEHLADSLRSAGIPSDPIYDKAAEGVLKGADDARIVAATRSLAKELGAASLLLGPGASTSDVVSAASALRAGVPAPDIQRLGTRRIKSQATDGRLALSFIILADFASRGVPVDAAFIAVDGLLARGAGGAELTAFRSGVERDLLAGRDARATLTTRAEGVLKRK
ncbi:MAG: hypothetical protein ABJB66_04260 [Gemmatimonadaceae bacterium]